MMTNEQLMMMRAALSRQTLETKALVLLEMDKDGLVHMSSVGDPAQLLWLTKNMEMMVEKIMRGEPL